MEWGKRERRVVFDLGFAVVVLGALLGWRVNGVAGEAASRSLVALGTVVCLVAVFVQPR